MNPSENAYCMAGKSEIDIRLLALGGTISMADSPSGARPAIHAGELAKPHERITSSVDVAFLGGSEVDFNVLSDLVREIDRAISDGVDGVVVTLGTDAIEEAAAWVSCSGPWSIPVVFTGSMLPGRTVGSDGLSNLSDAIDVAADPTTTEPVVVFGGRIFAAHEVLKVSGMERMAFDSPGRGSAGVIIAGRPHWHRLLLPWEFCLGRPGREFPQIPILLAYLGGDGELITAASARSEIIVIAGNGAGNLPSAQAFAAIKAANDGKLVVVVSRASDSRAGPLYGYPGGSATLAEEGVIVAPGLTPHRARVILSIGASQGLSLERLGSLFNKRTAVDLHPHRVS